MLSGKYFMSSLVSLNLIWVIHPSSVYVVIWFCGIQFSALGG